MLCILKRPFLNYVSMHVQYVRIHFNLTNQGQVKFGMYIYNSILSLKGNYEYGKNYRASMHWSLLLMVYFHEPSFLTRMKSSSISLVQGSSKWINMLSNTPVLEVC